MITKRRSKPRRRPVPVDDPARLEWIRSLPCLICYRELYRWLPMADFAEFAARSRARFGAQKSPTEAAHVGDRGLGQKCPDRETAPLCAEHHRTGKHAHHGPLGKKFWKYHRLDRDAILKQLQEAYEARGVPSQQTCLRFSARFSVMAPQGQRFSVRGRPGPACGVWREPV